MSPLVTKQHDGIDFEKLQEQGELLVRYARSLGLHGVMIMSPTCPRCGECHDFAVFTDIAEADEVAGLLSHYADAISDDAPQVEMTFGGDDQ